MIIKSRIGIGKDSYVVDEEGNIQTRANWKIQFGIPTRFVISTYLPVGDNVSLGDLDFVVNFLSDRLKEAKKSRG